MNSVSKPAGQPALRETVELCSNGKKVIVYKDELEKSIMEQIQLNLIQPFQYGA